MRILGFAKSGTILTSESEWSNLKLVHDERCRSVALVTMRFSYKVTNRFLPRSGWQH